MESLPTDWSMLMLTVFALGMKHGMDPDHLATIDGLARCNLTTRPRLARYAGCLFSLGHGAVVCAAATGIALVAARSPLPSWLEDLGAWTSIALLLALAVLNLHAVWRAPRDAMVASVGVKSHFFGRFRSARPAAIFGIGALFALSFDTLSQAALFALAATSLAGWGFALWLGLVFTAGMMATDGLNGWFVARMLTRADEKARIASRLMTFAVGGLSLAVALYGLAKYFAPRFAERSEGVETWLGAGLVALMLVSYLAARRLGEGALAANPASRER